LTSIIAAIHDTVRREVQFLGATSAPVPAAEETLEQFLVRVVRLPDRDTCSVCLKWDGVRAKREPCHLAHETIIVFRPCGHTMCKSCFHDYYEARTGVAIRPTVDPAQPWVTHPSRNDSRTDGGFPCDVCRADVVASFDALEEEIRSKTLWNTVDRERVNGVVARELRRSSSVTPGVFELGKKTT